ncbi:hypothetical protein AABB24_035852 [Solanum stoloniferum]|uniref:Uncharacterized protein n=1 Tax=Solanum stoloniferum TaxID=62892 RepID=A0ABD2R9N1_9SOLN
MYDNFKSQHIVPGRVVNLSQLKDSHCLVSSYLKVQKLSLLFSLCGLELFEEVVRLFYANLRISPDSGKLETLVLGNPWPNDFEVSLKGAKKVVAEPNFDISDFGPLSHVSNIVYCRILLLPLSFPGRVP